MSMATLLASGQSLVEALTVAFEALALGMKVLSALKTIKIDDFYNSLK